MLPLYHIHNVDINDVDFTTKDIMMAERILLRRLLPAVLAGLVVSFAFITFFTSALHDPRPNGLDIGVVGPAPVVVQVDRELAQALPGAFDVHGYPTLAAARDALRAQRIDGAFAPGGRSPTLLLAGASGANATNVLRAAFGGAASAKGQRLRIDDAAPLPSHDSRGIAAFFVVAGTTMGAIIFSAILFLLGGHAGGASLRLRLTLMALFAALVGTVGAIGTNLVAGGMTASFFAVAGIAALLAAVISLLTTALVRWVGAPGVGLAMLLLTLFSLPATGGPIGPEFVPDFYRSIAPALPSHAALQALKGAVYYGGGGTTTPILVLLAWMAAAVTIHGAARVIGHHGPWPPPIGRHVFERPSAEANEPAVA